MNDKKICFIICSNNDLFLQECLLYLRQLEIPEGYTLDTISIRDAKSMAAGYNEGMRATDAKYKVYMHQDVFIRYWGFLKAILEIFESDASIGMIGMVGAPKMSADGVMWHTGREGGLIGAYLPTEAYGEYTYHVQDGLHEVEAIDGLMMITNRDIPWREDILDGWDFYDVSQSLEFARRGYKIVVPEQRNPWCEHYDKILNLSHYNKYRKICMAEYPEYFEQQASLTDCDAISREEEALPEESHAWQMPEKTQDSKKEGKAVPKLCLAFIVQNELKWMREQADRLLEEFQDSDITIVIVDNGSTDGLTEWLSSQQLWNYILCDKPVENYADICNMLCAEFAADRDFMVVSPKIEVTGELVERMQTAIYRQKEIGACSLQSVCNQKPEEDAWSEGTPVLSLREDIFLIKKACLEEVGAFDKKLKLPENVLMDYSLRCILAGYQIYQLDAPCTARVPSVYSEIYPNNVDRNTLKEKWGMHYFNLSSNDSLLSLVECEEDAEINVLEIGCDLGANLLGIKRKYKNAHLYGMEINEAAARIASCLFQTEVADIEKQEAVFEGVKFDYIIFGDVLEHLHDPKAILTFCKEAWLKPDGRIVASIPNLMHFSVMKGLLLWGNFTYSDSGLLDRTHIHMFTRNEIIRMFTESGFQIEKMLYTAIPATEEDVSFVNRLLESNRGNVEPDMYYAYQYQIAVRNH